jgi:hypothetical protein
MAVPKKRTSKSKKNKRKSAWKKKAEIWGNIGDVELDPMPLFEPPSRLKGGLRIKTRSRIKIQLIKGQGFKKQSELVISKPMEIEIIKPEPSQLEQSQSKVMVIDIVPSENISSETSPLENVQSENIQSENIQSKKPL